MKKFGLTILIVFFLSLLSVKAQVSADCVNAVPICNNTPINGGTNGFGVDDFNGESVSGCIAQASGTIETNSAWYRFRTGESGQLGFNIGFDTSEDWDFALYRTSDCSNLGEPVRCNYFDNSDDSSFIGVGEDPTGINNIQYDDWLDVVPGEEYYLLINNFSNNNSGFSIQFSGAIFSDFPNTALDCSIIDNLLGPPVVACDNETIVLNATTEEALAYEWYLDTGMGYQRIITESNSTLTVAVSAMYRVLVVMPSGENIISETQVAYTPAPITYDLEDESVCLDQTVFDLSLKDVEALGDESSEEFRISYHNNLQEAINGVNAIAKQFIPTQAAQTIFVRTTSVENGDCYDVSQSFEISSLPLPNLDFETEVFICGDAISVTIGEEIPNSAYSYMWNTGENTASLEVVQEGVYTLSVTNTEENLQCVSVRSVNVVFSRPPIIEDVVIDYEDDSRNEVNVILNETGNFEYQLDDEVPQSESRFQNLFPGEHTITVNDLNGCGTATAEIVIVGFPKFFTPNADGVNDIWNVAGLSVLENPVVTIFDRYGKFIHQITEDTNGWNGSFNGTLLPESDYWFRLSYTDSNGQITTAKYINNHFTLKR